MTRLGARSTNSPARSVVRQPRQPANVVAPVIFPLGLLAVNSGGLQPATRIPGFPTDHFVAFALAIPFLQGALFATMNAGTDLARDIQTGFLNRLSLTPMRGVGADRRDSSPAPASPRSCRRSSTSPSAMRSAYIRAAAPAASP